MKYILTFILMILLNLPAVLIDTMNTNVKHFAWFVIGFNVAAIISKIIDLENQKP